MDIEEIRQRISSLEEKVSGVKGVSESDELIILRLRLTRSATALERLVSQYKRLAVISFILSVTYILLNVPFDDIWLNIALGGFFVICGGMDLYLYLGMKSIDVATMGVLEVARRALFYRRKHHQFQIILIPLGACLLFFLGWHVRDNHGMLVGMVCGIIIGAAVGINIYCRIMRDYKTLYKSGKDF